MGLRVEVCSAPAVLGEGPHWDAKNQCLYYVDLFGNAIHKYSPSKDKNTKVQFGKFSMLKMKKDVSKFWSVKIIIFSSFVFLRNHFKYYNKFIWSVLKYIKLKENIYVYYYF